MVSAPISTGDVLKARAHPGLRHVRFAAAIHDAGHACAWILASEIANSCDFQKRYSGPPASTLLERLSGSCLDPPCPRVVTGWRFRKAATLGFDAQVFLADAGYFGLLRNVFSSLVKAAIAASGTQVTLAV